MEFTHLSWQQSLGRTCRGHHNMVLSIPLYNGRSRKWPLCESRSHHCGSEPDGTGSHNSTNKKKNEVEIRFYTEKTAITYWHTLYLTVLSVVSCWASAAVGAQAVRAGASIFTGLRVTLILLVFTEHPVKSRTAMAREGVDAIDASPVIQTGAKERIDLWLRAKILRNNIEFNKEIVKETDVNNILHWICSFYHF